jgi:hypothetical protein
MTLRAQLRWLQQEQRRCQCLLAGTLVMGETVLEKARADLCAIEALMVTVREADAPFFPTRNGP